MNDSSSADETRVLSRRSFFAKVGLAAGGAMLLGLPKFLIESTSPAEAALKGSYASGTVGLELEGQFAGLLSGVEGGNPFADIISEGVGPDMIQRKRPGPPRFEDIVLDVDFSQITKPLSGWIGDTLSKIPTPRNGAILYADFNYKEVKRLEFMGAVITEIGTPLCDPVGAKAPAALSLRIAPQSTRFSGGSGKNVLSMAGAKSAKIVSSNFAFTIQGFEDACKRIINVDAIVAKRPVAASRAGQEKFLQQPGVLDCSPVVIRLPEAYAGPFYKWFDDTVVKGMQVGEMSGHLTWTDQAGAKAGNVSVQLGGLGIVRYALEPANAKAGTVVRVEMYCETMNMSIL
ncbi:MAG: hypothetical protein NTNFB02_33940 [Nitrospira sp.]